MPENGSRRAGSTSVMGNLKVLANQSPTLLANRLRIRLMDNHDALVERIQQVYPDLVVETARLNRQGWSNDVLVVNEQLIFRFPRTLEGLQILAAEQAILRGIKGRTSLPVPDPIYYALAPQA